MSTQEAESELSGLTSQKQSNQDGHPQSQPRNYSNRLCKIHNNKSGSFQGSVLKYQYIDNNDQALDETTEAEYDVNVSRFYNKTNSQRKPAVSPLHHVSSTTSVVSMAGSQPSTPFPGAIMRYHTANQLSTIPTSNSDDTAGTNNRDKNELNISWNERLLNLNIWRAAIVELIASMIICFMSSCGVKMSITYFPQYPPLPIGIVTGLLVTLIIFGTAQSSGGHFNWLITLSTTFCGLCEIERCIVYLPMQLIGYCAGTGLYQIVIGKAGQKVSGMELTGCTVGEATDWQAFIVEIMATLSVLIIAFGTVFDPAQGQIYGQFAAPWFIGIVVAIIIMTTSAIYPVFTGAFTNPTRCLSPAIIAGDLDNIWPFVIGPIVGAALFAPLYIFIPPNHVDKYSNTKN